MPLTVSCFSKIQIGFNFWYWPTWVVLEKGPLNVCVCVCVCARARAAMYMSQQTADSQIITIKSQCKPVMLLSSASVCGMRKTMGTEQLD